MECCKAFLLIVILVIAFLIIYFRHTPHSGLSQEIIELIKNNGLVHFTSKTAADNIIVNGFDPAYVRRPLNLAERNMIWFYIYDENNIEELIRKSGVDKAQAYIKVFPSEEEIKKMRIRDKGFKDYAISYKVCRIWKPRMEKHIL